MLQRTVSLSKKPYGVKFCRQEFFAICEGGLGLFRLGK